MPDPTNYIDALLQELRDAQADGYTLAGSQYAALSALVAERNALREQLRLANIDQFNTEAEANDRDRELRERDKAMALWMEEVTKWLGLALSYCGAGRGELGTRCDAAIAAMRKENDNA